MKRARHKQGSVVFNRRNKSWHYLWCENGHRRSKLIGSIREYATKAAAWRVAEVVRASVQKPGQQVLKVVELAKRYEAEKLPTRSNTARVYRAWLRNHILPLLGKPKDKGSSTTRDRAVAQAAQPFGQEPRSRSPHAAHAG